MKKFICALIAAVVACATVAFSGCSFRGRDGRDGQDLNIYEIFEATNAARAEAGESQLDFLEFLREYLHYDFEYDPDDAFQSIVNRSLLSAVSVYSVFEYGTNLSSYSAYGATGSGVIVDIDKEAGDAYVLTNCHVVYDDTAINSIATKVEIYLYGGEFNDDAIRQYVISGKVVSASITYDLALIKITGSQILKNSDAIAAVFSDSEEVYVGQRVYTVGNAEGMGLSATMGYVNKENEEISLNISEKYPSLIDYYHDYRVFRTDAAVNEGNSGGGLFDGSGRLIGLINAKNVASEVDNIAYALPAAYVKRIYALMMDGYGLETGGLTRAVFPAEYSYHSRAYFDNDTGLTKILDTVTVYSAGGGLRRGDVVKSIKLTRMGETVEDMEITRYYNVNDVLLSARRGDKVIYTVLRGDEEVQVETLPGFEACV